MGKWLLICLLLCSGLLFPQGDSLNEDPDFSVITIRKPGFRIYSDAYTYMRFAFLNQVMSFDTTRFDNRYDSYEYCRITKKRFNYRTGRIQNAYFRIRTEKNRIDKKVCFSLMLRPGLHDITWLTENGSYSLTLGRLCPEMQIYRNFDWILDEPMRRKEFRRLMRNMRWYDIRLEYDDGDDAYTMVLKGAENSFSIRAYPVRNMKILPDKFQRPDPGKLYKQYSKTLNRTKKRFDIRIEKRIRHYRNMEEREWNRPIIRFSEEELAMSRDEWLEYCNRILENEQEYLLSAPFYPQLLMRTLPYRSYLPGNFRMRSPEESYRCKLENDSLAPLVKQVIYINRGNMQYFNQLSIKYDTENTFLSPIIPDNDIMTVLILNNGMVALSRQAWYDESRNEYNFQFEIFDPALLIISDVLDFLNI